MVLLKIGLVGPVDQQINLVSPNTDISQFTLMSVTKNLENAPAQVLTHRCFPVNIAKIVRTPLVAASLTLFDIYIKIYKGINILIHFVFQRNTASHAATTGSFVWQSMVFQMQIS